MSFEEKVGLVTGGGSGMAFNCRRPPWVGKEDRKRWLAW